MAESTRPVRRMRGLTGSVRRYASQAVARLVAIPTPNWKKVTVRIPVAAKPISRRCGSPRSNARPRTRSITAGNARVGAAYAG